VLLVVIRTLGNLSVNLLSKINELFYEHVVLMEFEAGNLCQRRHCDPITVVKSLLLQLVTGWVTTAQQQSQGILILTLYERLYGTDMALSVHL
jgi:hypothetical protein